MERTQCESGRVKASLYFLHSPLRYIMQGVNSIKSERVRMDSLEMSACSLKMCVHIDCLQFQYCVAVMLCKFTCMVCVRTLYESPTVV